MLDLYNVAVGVCFGIWIAVEALRDVPPRVKVAAGAAAGSLLLAYVALQLPQAWQLPAALVALVVALPSFPYWIRSYGGPSAGRDDEDGAIDLG